MNGAPSIDPDDMDLCEGTKEQPHLPVWVYRPLQEVVTEDGFHTRLARVGHCPVCLMLNHTALG